MIKVAHWVIDQYNVWNFKHPLPNGREVHLWIQQRPDYCDRGHWSFNADGPFDLDSADSFPRYYMCKHTAMREAIHWLNWRLYKIPYGQQEWVTLIEDNRPGGVCTSESVS